MPLICRRLNELQNKFTTFYKHLQIIQILISSVKMINASMFASTIKDKKKSATCGNVQNLVPGRLRSRPLARPNVLTFRTPITYTSTSEISVFLCGSFLDLQPTEGFYCNNLFIQYYSVICRPSEYTVGRPRAELRTRDGRFRGRNTNNYRPLDP